MTQTKAIDNKYTSPQRILLVTILSIFLSEIIAMTIVYYLHDFPYWIVSLVDGLITVVVVFPLIYSFSFRSLLEHITERKLSEQKLISANQLLERLFSSIDTHIAYMDANFNYLRVNEAFAREGGHPAEYFFGKNHFQLFPDEDNEAIYRRVVQDGKPHSEYGDPFEYPELPEKAVTYWNWSLQPLWNADDEVDGLVLSMSDVTGLKNAEKKLEEQYQEMLKLSIAEHKQRQLAETLSEVSLALNQTLDLETVMDTLLEYVHRLVPYDCATIFLSEDEGRLGVRSNRCYNDNICCNPGLHTVIDIWDYPFIQVVIANQESFLIEDVKAYQDWATGLYGENMQNWLGIPMLVGGNAIGIIGLAKTNPGFFNSMHIQLAESIAAQVSVAVQNAWLFEQVRAGHERLQSLSRRLVDVQESERRYISRELHDETSQALTSIVFGLRLLEQAEERSENIKPRIAELKGITDRVLENLHRLAVNLRPVSLDHLGLIPALEQLIKDMSGNHHINIGFKQIGFDQGERLPEELATSLYRIAQEALTNAVRHANANRINLILEQRDDQVVVIVEDDGIGFDTDVILKSGHLGLLGMQERAQMILGNLQIESLPGQGTTIVVEIPYAHPNIDR